MLNFDDELLSIGDEPQYFFFKTGEDIYAIEATFVKEMLEYQPLTKVPLMPSFVKGVTNIRGEIITVIDLLDRLRLGETSLKKKSALVIIDNIALIIDEILEVAPLDENLFKSPLEFGFKIEQKFIKHMALYEDNYIALLNCDTLLNHEELSTLEEVS